MIRRKWNAEKWGVIVAVLVTVGAAVWGSVEVAYGAGRKEGGATSRIERLEADVSELKCDVKEILKWTKSR